GEARIDDVDLDHNNPLHLAIKNEHYDICVALLEKNSEMVDAPDCNGQSPLMLSCWKHNVKITELCLQYTTSVNAVDWTGQNSLHYACKSNNSEAVNVLFKHGIDIFQTNDQGLSPFHIVSANGNSALLKQLMEYLVSSASVAVAVAVVDNATQGDQLSQKILAVCHQNDDKGWTLLHHASASGDRSVVKYLLSVGADSSVTDKHGFCPHCVAVFFGRLQLYDLLTPCVRQYPANYPNKPYDLIDTTDKKECDVRFHVQCHAKQSQHVYLVGDCLSLGLWEVGKGVQMTSIQTTVLDKDVENDTNFWTCNVILPKDTKIQYRYVIASLEV
ncbi:hypothetical protein RFI_18835, partial [Reticulomyxa filosa]